jgi:hypothetical protein
MLFVASGCVPGSQEIGTDVVIIGHSDEIDFHCHLSNTSDISTQLQHGKGDDL